MASVIKRKPTSPGRRFVVSVVDNDLHKGKPFAALTESKNRIHGRNNRGKITVRHRGGGHKQRYRVIDFKRNKDDIQATVERIEYDPNRLRILLLFFMQMVSVVILLLLKVLNQVIRLFREIQLQFKKEIAFL